MLFTLFSLPFSAQLTLIKYRVLQHGRGNQINEESTGWRDWPKEEGQSTLCLTSST